MTPAQVVLLVTAAYLLAGYAIVRWVGVEIADAPEGTAKSSFYLTKCMIAIVWPLFVVLVLIEVFKKSDE